jgi:hypothetical protein
MNITTIITAVTLSAATLGYVIYQDSQHKQTQTQLKQQIEALNAHIDSLAAAKANPSIEMLQPLSVVSTSTMANSQVTNKQVAGPQTRQGEAPKPRDLANVDRRLIEQHNIKRIEELARQGKNPDVLFQKAKKKGEADL